MSSALLRNVKRRTKYTICASDEDVARLFHVLPLCRSCIGVINSQLVQALRIFQSPINLAGGCADDRDNVEGHLP
jgi:hypothetical protein